MENCKEKILENNDDNKLKPQLEKGNYVITVVSEDKILKKIMVVNSEIYVDHFVDNSLAIDI